MKKVILVLCLCGVLILSGCSTTLVTKGIKDVEYGTKLKKDTIFKYSEDVKFESSVDVDSSVVGEYEVKATAEKGDEKEEYSEKITVKDTKKSEIKLVQKKKKQIPFGATYKIAGNIDEISDDVDGEMKDVVVMNVDEYENGKKSANTAKETINKRKFKKNEDVEAAKKEDNGKKNYTAIYTNVDVNKAGTYDVKVASIDSNYNVNEVTYSVEVLAEGEKVDSKKLAAGCDEAQMGKVIDNYNITSTSTTVTILSKDQSTIIKKVEKEEKVEEVVSDPNSMSGGDTTVYSSSTINNYNGSPLVNAALGLVGSSMWCDDLITQALINAGMMPSGLFIPVSAVPYFGSEIGAGSAAPGDLVYYNNGGVGGPHVAVYGGNGMAIHGGFNGMVKIFSVNLPNASAPRYFRIPSYISQELYNSVLTSPPSGGGGSDSGNGAGEYHEVYNVNVNGVNIQISGTGLNIDAINTVVTDYCIGNITIDELKSKITGFGYTVSVG